MTGEDLRALIWHKWGRSYDVQLRQIKGEWYLQIMWKYLEQTSFPLTEDQYAEHIEAIATYLGEWGVSTQVEQFLTDCNDRPRVGKAISLRLTLGERASEWLLN